MKIKTERDTNKKNANSSCHHRNIINWTKNMYKVSDDQVRRFTSTFSWILSFSQVCYHSGNNVNALNLLFKTRCWWLGNKSCLTEWILLNASITRGLRCYPSTEADPGFSGTPNPRGGATQTYYSAYFLPKTAWKWKIKLDWIVHVPRAP